LRYLYIVVIFIFFIGCGNWSDVELYPNVKTKLHQLDKSDDSYHYVVDGDTIKVRFDSKITTVRLIGIDSFETRLNDKAYRQAYQNDITVEEVLKRGEMAKEYLKDRLKNQKEFYFEYDEDFLDRYGRVLGYLWLNEDEMLNLEMVCKGYAMPLKIEPNTRYSLEIRECYEKAKENGLGVWGD
jgi:micrococcal nuclease